ncbi:MAG: isovaleryl-CoA dehydrogenase [Gordonia sp.]|nr:isovaleryl-CoA dehydrogenase [Gordonia sp. (in: high G+C Gram-positive bacteria)]
MAATSDEEFRATLRNFFSEFHPGRAPREPVDRAQWQRSWQATMYDNGFAGPSWPREYGGMDLSFARQVIYQEELARARVPRPLGTGLGIAAPTIITYGTEEQKQRFLPAMLRADKVWAQCYSEPGAGSDLPGLRTTARRDRDEYVVNGQKVWTTQANLADTFFALVRTGTLESRQRGITYLIIDAHSSGVQVRPLRDMTGGHTFSEVFFDNVRVPIENRIGEEDKGWPLVRTSLGHERAAGAMNQAAVYRRVLSDLEDLARNLEVNTNIEIRDKLADFEIRVRIMRLNAARTISDIMTTGEPGASSSVSRLFITQFEQELHEFAVEICGPAGLLTKKSDHSVQGGRWLYGFIRTRASTIGAGTSEIQRNTMAEQVLKLPHDPGMPPR